MYNSDFTPCKLIQDPCSFCHRTTSPYRGKLRQGTHTHAHPCIHMHALPSFSPQAHGEEVSHAVETRNHHVGAQLHELVYLCHQTQIQNSSLPTLNLINAYLNTLKKSELLNFNVCNIELVLSHLTYKCHVNLEFVPSWRITLY